MDTNTGFHSRPFTAKEATVVGGVARPFIINVLKEAKIKLHIVIGLRIRAKLHSLDRFLGDATVLAFHLRATAGQRPAVKFFTEPLFLLVTLLEMGRIHRRGHECAL